MVHNTRMPDHHAVYCFASAYTEDLCKGTSLLQDSELVLITRDIFSIADVRSIIAKAYQKPFEKKLQTFVIDTPQLAVEAQHALLKILEEPPASARFVFVIRPHTTLLPTVRSRLMYFHVSGLANQPQLATVFTDFIEASFAERIDLIARLTQDKSISKLSDLADSLSMYLDQTRHSLTSHEQTHLLWCLSTLRLHGASKKMIWEDVALRIPISRPLVIDNNKLLL